MCLNILAIGGLIQKDLGDSLQGSKLGLAHDKQNELLEHSKILWICFVWVACFELHRLHAHSSHFVCGKTACFTIWLYSSEDKSCVDWHTCHSWMAISQFTYHQSRSHIVCMTDWAVFRSFCQSSSELQINNNTEAIGWNWCRRPGILIPWIKQLVTLLTNGLPRIPFSGTSHNVAARTCEKYFSRNLMAKWQWLKSVWLTIAFWLFGDKLTHFRLIEAVE